MFMPGVRSAIGAAVGAVVGLLGDIFGDHGRSKAKQYNISQIIPRYTKRSTRSAGAEVATTRPPGTSTTCRRRRSSRRSSGEPARGITTSK